MKNFLSFLALAVMLMLSVSSAKAQNGAFAPYADAGLGYISGQAIGAGNPTYTLGGGIESSTKYILADVNGQFTGNNLSGNGYIGTASGAAYLKLDKFLVGGGAEWTGITLSNAKTAITLNGAHPFIGAGIQLKRDRFLVNYELPLGPNTLPGESVFNIHNEFFITKSAHLRFTQDLTINSNNASLHNARTTLETASVGIKLVL